jgi:predicted amidohydrolase YtcJ
MAPVKALVQEQELGSITPGKRADIVFLDRNIFAFDPMGIADVRVDSLIY